MTSKEYLLRLSCVVDNPELDAYVALINAAAVSSEKYTEKHHIIPVAYYKQNCLEIDNSATNIVSLTAVQHILAHYYACFFFTGEMRVSMQYAFILMTSEDMLKLDPHEITFIRNLEHYTTLRENFRQQLKCRKMSELTREKLQPTWFKQGTPPWNKGVPCKESTKQKLREYNLSTPSTISDEGKARISAANSHPKSEETIQKMKAYSSNRSEEHLQKLADAAKGKTHANDGTRNRWWKVSEPLPDGWSWGWI